MVRAHLGSPDESDAAMIERNVLEETGLLPALQRLDALLERAAATAAVRYGPDAAEDPYRGLVIGPDEIVRLLQRFPGDPILFAGDRVNEDVRGYEFDWLGQTFDLTPFDLDVLLLAIAPEIDLRYERLYAYLQDDATRRRPAVDLALNLFSSSAAVRIEQRARFAPDAPLLRHRLIHLIDNPHQPHQPLLARAIRVDEQVLRFVLREPTLDPRLASCASRVIPNRSLLALPLDPETWQRLPLRALDPATGMAPPRLYFHGQPGCGQGEVAEALATEAGLPLLVVDCARARDAEAPIAEIIRIAFREAWFQGSGLFLKNIDAVHGEPASSLAALLIETVSTSQVLTILSGELPWTPADAGPDSPVGVAVVPFGVPRALARRACWERALTAAGFDVDARIVESLAALYRLTPARIAEAVATASNAAEWSGNGMSSPDFFAAARAQSGHELAASARMIEPIHRWDSLILPESELEQLCELRDRVAQRQRVLSEWGFENVLALGRGICALFAGSSGTGKTMAAGVIAGELRLDLYKIDLATVVSKYIGDTEKNLERIFNAAEGANAVLFFDEADAIFGKRSAVRDAHDRYANLEIAYLLQKMEQYDGIAILATNLRQNLDEAFLRRLHVVIEFPMPDELHREQMWRRFIPRDAPVDDSIDYAFLARHFRLSGGNIKNIVVSAAYLAAANGGCISMPHLIRATWREHQKIGRLLSETDIGDYAAVLPSCA